MKMNLDPIISATCEDCGITLIMDKDLITVVELDGDFTGVTICFHCERPLINPIPVALVKYLYKKEVRILSWSSDEIEF
jgi:hypothetical protein